MIRGVHFFYPATHLALLVIYMQQKKVSIIIVSYNVQAFLELCLDSVMRAVRSVPAEIIVVDNNSSDGSCAMVAERFKEVILIANKDNAGFSKANNQGVAIAQGTYIHFLNPDTVVPEDFYEQTIAYLDRHPEIGCLGPKLLDGRGQYAYDSKKSFPSFWTSVYKVTGLSKLFPRSVVFNRYYAAHVGENETAAVDILSGCCLLVRSSAMEAAGGSFDESYFMYCEDVDLCHRVQQAGYKNYYYPETSIIHYKGESTRKLSARYIKIFYEAHALFVKRYYPKRLGAIYIFSLKMVLALRNFFNWGRYLFSLFKMFLLDALLLFIVTTLVKDFWFDNIAPRTMPPGLFGKTIPLFLCIWLLSLFLNGAYDKPFSLFKAGRGMVLGTILVLAGYGLLPMAYRYSRGVVLFSGMTGAVVLLLIRWLLSSLGWIRLVPRGKIDYKAAIVGNTEEAQTTETVLEQQHYNLEIVGRVSPTTNDNDQSLGQTADLSGIQQVYNINEFVFNSGSLSYKEIMQRMGQTTRPFFKIHVAGSNAIVGSNSLKHNAEEFSLSKRYAISAADSRRNKRIFDLATGVALLLLYPVLSFKVADKRGFRKNIISVIAGKKTWVGYSQELAAAKQLPPISTPVIPPYPLNTPYIPDRYNQEHLSEQYAENFAALDDFRIVWVNFKFLGKNF